MCFHYLSTALFIYPCLFRWACLLLLLFFRVLDVSKRKTTPFPLLSWCVVFTASMSIKLLLITSDCLRNVIHRHFLIVSFICISILFRSIYLLWLLNPLRDLRVLSKSMSLPSPCKTHSSVFSTSLLSFWLLLYCSWLLLVTLLCFINLLYCPLLIVFFPDMFV